MQRTYKFRLYPTKENKKKLFWTLDKCRFIYNKMLEGLNKQDKPNMFELMRSLPQLKENHSELKNVYSKTLQREPYRLFSNLRALARLKKNGKKVGRLRFKGRTWFKTFTYNQSGFKVIEREIRYDSLKLSKIGEIPMLMHREITGKIKQITVKHHPSGKWFVSIAAEVKEEIKPTENKKKVGIDLGLNSFTFDSDGNSSKHPKALRNSLKKLAKVQRKLSKRKRGSKNKNKQRLKVARIHEKVGSQRYDFLHKLSRYYINSYGFIAVEKLNVRGMIKNRYLSKSIADASWTKFVQLLEYKAESAGFQVVKVDAKYTSQTCSQCERIVKKSLAVRTHSCGCGLTIDRDYNAAINILKKAIGQELSEFQENPKDSIGTPVEISIRKSLKQETPHLQKVAIPAKFGLTNRRSGLSRSSYTQRSPE